MVPDSVVLKWNDSETRLTRTDEIYSESAFYKIKTQYLAQWLGQNNPFYPKVVIWGASRLSRRRAELLLDFGIEIKAYIDINMDRQIGKEIIYYEDLPNSGSLFVLTYINHLDVRMQVQQFLHKRGYVEGERYLTIS